MTKRDLIDEVVKLFPRFSRRDAEVMVNEVFDTMTQAMVCGERPSARSWVRKRSRAVRRRILEVAPWPGRRSRF